MFHDIDLFCLFSLDICELAVIDVCKKQRSIRQLCVNRLLAFAMLWAESRKEQWNGSAFYTLVMSAAFLLSK